VDAWKAALAGLTQVDISTGVASVLAVKDETELVRQYRLDVS
jgi:hypothetical protein